MPIWTTPFPKPSYFFSLVPCRLRVLETFHHASGAAQLRLHVEPGPFTAHSHGLNCNGDAWDDAVYGWSTNHR